MLREPSAGAGADSAASGSDWHRAVLLRGREATREAAQSRYGDLRSASMLNFGRNWGRSVQRSVSSLDENRRITKPWRRDGMSRVKCGTERREWRGCLTEPSAAKRVASVFFDDKSGKFCARR